MQTSPEADLEPSGPGCPPGMSGIPYVFTPEALLPGSKLDEFEIVRVLGAGGFGIVYLALDQLLLRYVAIKEFIPTTLASRNAEGRVVVRTPEAAQTFEMGLDSFYNEGRLLARFDHPSLVRVFRFWKANGTAYMAMQYYPGQTLKEARRQMLAPPDEAWLRTFIDRLLGALHTLHAEGVFHRDIAPDNILLLPDGQPVILDFGSARRVISDRTQSLTAILKPNYSPVEQYADDAGMRQGGYTDLYALGGTVYFMLCGKEPIPAVMRAVRDSFPVLAQSPAAPFDHVSREFLAVVDWMLGVSPDDRPQTVEQTRATLRGEVTPPPPTERYGVVISEPGQVYDASRAMAKTELVVPTPPPVAPVPTSAAALAAAPSPATTPAPTSAPAPKARRRPSWLVISGVTVATCAALFWAVIGTPQRSSAASPVAAAAASAAPVPASASASAPDAIVAPASVAVVDLPVRPAVPVTSAAAESPRNAKLPTSAASAARPTTRALARTASPVSVAALPSQDAVSSSSLPAPKPVVVPTTAVAGGALCADMNIFARVSCLSRACEAPQTRSHPQCVEARRIAEQRQQRMNQ